MRRSAVTTADREDPMNTEMGTGKYQRLLEAHVPIILTTRADSVRARIASCAVAMPVAHARRQALLATRCR